MKKTIFILISLMAMSILLFTGCSQYINNGNEIIQINNEQYEISDSDWIVYGEAIDNGEYYLYKCNSKTVFAKSKDNKLFEGIVYHNTNDVYPDISITNNIDKIVLDINGKQIVLDKEMTTMLINELLNTDHSHKNVSNANISTAEIYVNVYYKNYPAYQNEFFLCRSDNNELGFMYCVTEKNDNKLGKGSMKLFEDNRLISYIESLDFI